MHLTLEWLSAGAGPHSEALIGMLRSAAASQSGWGRSQRCPRNAGLGLRLGSATFHWPAPEPLPPLTTVRNVPIKAPQRCTARRRK